MAHQARTKERKTSRLNLRVSEADAEAMHLKAEAAGVSISDFLRAAALNVPMPKRSTRKPVKHADELAAVLRHTGRIGNNINQLARVANAGSWPDAESIQQARADIQWMRHAVMRALGVYEDESQDQPQS